MRSRGRLGRRRLVIGGQVEIISDGLAPGIRAEGVDVFVLGEVQGLDERLAEIGECGGGFGFDLTLGDSGEEASEGGAEIAGGHIAAGKVIGDILAGLLASEGLRFLAGVEGAEVRMAVTARSAALAAIGKGERTQRRAVVFTCDRTAAVFRCDRRAVNGASRHGSLQKERFGILGESRGGRDALLNKDSLPE